MTTVSYPGVYMEEVSSGVRPIQSASTSTCAFIGVADQGEIGAAHKIFSFTEFTALYGGFRDDGYLAHSVYQFFNNGGSQAYIVRVARDAETAAITLADRAAAPMDTMTVSAAAAGEHGNHLQIRVSDSTTDPENAFDLEVHRFAPTDDVPVLLEGFADLTMDPAAARYAASVVNLGSLQIRLSDPLVANTNVIAGFAEGTPVPAGADPLLGDGHRRLRISLHGDGLQEVDLTTALTAADLTDAEVIRAALEGEIQALVPLRASSPPTAYSAAAVTVATDATGHTFTITSGAAALDSSVDVQAPTDLSANAAGPLGFGGGMRVVGGASQLRPPATAPGAYYLLGDAPLVAPITSVTAGSDGVTPQDVDYIAGFNALDTIRDVSLLAVPGVGSEAVADAGMNYCQNRPLSDIFFIADMAAQDDLLTEAEAWRDAIAGPNSYGAVYFPWVRMLDPTGGPEPILAPPSGFVAGIYARTDSRRGVWTSPAGLDANVAGAVGLATELTDVQHGLLNVHPKSVSVIRRFPASGIVLWGARTLSSDPEWRYVSPRRMAIFLRVSIFNGIQWAVFQPNDEPLWSQLRLNLNAFMTTLFRRGAFQGSTPADAFFVKVDSETTTQADIDNGVVNVLVGFAPLKPAEFVVVKISQKAGQSG